MVLQANVRFGWGMAPSSPPPPPPCWASRCSWRSPWSLQQFSESSSIFSSNICMRFNLRYCFWLSDNKQRNYTQCYTPLVNSWWWMTFDDQLKIGGSQPYLRFWRKGSPTTRNGGGKSRFWTPSWLFLKSWSCGFSVFYVKEASCLMSSYHCSAQHGAAAVTRTKPVWKQTSLTTTTRRNWKLMKKRNLSVPTSLPLDEHQEPRTARDSTQVVCLFVTISSNIISFIKCIISWLVQI